MADDKKYLPKKIPTDPVPMQIHIDPVPGSLPHCVCDRHPEIPCEFPCWQQVGWTDFDPADPNGCCCARMAKALGLPPIKPKTPEEREADRRELAKWIAEKVRERHVATPE